MSKILEKEILNNLKGVQDPSQNNNIVDLGFVKNIEVKENNKRQCLFPEGSIIIPNNNGTASGFIIESNNKNIEVVKLEILKVKTWFWNKDLSSLDSID